MRARVGGFTLIELMVALVVAGLLMASLVALSGSFRRSFGRTKDLTELQANLRFAMKTVAEDFSRAGFMASPDPASDPQYPEYFGNPIDRPALSFDDSTGTFAIRGNFSSARDFWFQFQGGFSQGKLCCRDGMPYNSTIGCQVTALSGDDYLYPFGKLQINPGLQSQYDQDRFDHMFCADPNISYRLMGPDGKYYLRQLAAANAGTFTFTLANPVNPSGTWKGHNGWINPVSQVRYRMEWDKSYSSPYPSSTVSRRWMLLRRQQTCNGEAVREVAGFLLPPQAAFDPPGFEVQYYGDTNGPYNPQVPRQPSFDQARRVEVAADLDPLNVYALVLTLRGRTEAEDPDFKLGALDTDLVPARNFAVDLDNNKDDGLARVRVERTVVEMRSLSQERYF
jgi:prepilin-type N-terminal cleavage/methylation domain-containing protein